MNRLNATWLAATLGAAVILATAAAPVYSQTAAPAPGPMRGHRLERMQAALGLTDDQMASIRQFRDGQRDQRRQVYRALHDARLALRELVMSGAPDDQIQAKTAELQTYAAQGMALRIEAMKNLAHILSPEQKEKLKTLQRPGWRS